MTDKELRKLKREDLLELLLQQSREIERLQQELEQAREQAQQSGEICLAPENAGNLAEAALQVSNVFQEAQKAADAYLADIATMNRQQREAAARREQESERRAQETLAQAQARCIQMEEETRVRCEELLHAAEQDAGRNWREMEEKIAQLNRSSEEMRALLTTDKKRRWRG